MLATEIDFSSAAAMKEWQGNQTRQNTKLNDGGNVGDGERHYRRGAEMEINMVWTH